MKVEDADSSEITREHVRLIKGSPPVRVAIFAAFNDAYKELADLVRPNWLAYAERHNYALRFYPHGYHLDPAHPASYGDKNRFNWYYDMRGLCEIVVYLDIDSLFVNMGMSIESALGWRPFLWTYGEGGPMSGLMIMRTNDRSEKHLRYAYEYAAANNNVRHGTIEPNGISDQDAMTRLMHVPPFSVTFGNCVEAESVGFCYTDTSVRNPWIVTCHGGSRDEKIAAMKGINESALSAQEVTHAR